MIARLVVAVAFVATTALMSTFGSVPLGASGPVERYQPPVQAPVRDPFRPPDQPWLAGNRGLEYQTEPGTPVGAIGPGLVVFAGQVGGTLHVTVLHPDGLRSSYSFLASIAITEGDRVRTGQIVGTTGSLFHLGVRAGERYIDPAALFGQVVGRAKVFLVPAGSRGSDAVGGGGRRTGRERVEGLGPAMGERAMDGGAMTETWSFLSSW